MRPKKTFESSAPTLGEAKLPERANLARMDPQLRAQREAEVRRGTAYHEAGHAVAHLLRGRSPEVVSIVPTDDLLGFVRTREVRCSGTPRAIVENFPHAAGEVRDGLASAVVAHLAGHVAQGLLWGCWLDLGDLAPDEDLAGDGDIARALRLLTDFLGSENKAWRWLVRIRDDAESLLKTFEAWHAVELIAKALLKTPHLEGDQLDTVLEEASEILKPLQKELVRKEKRRNSARARRLRAKSPMEPLRDGDALFATPFAADKESKEFSDMRLWLGDLRGIAFTRERMTRD